MSYVLTQQQDQQRTAWFVITVTLVAFSIFDADPLYSVEYLLRNELIENIDVIVDQIATAYDPRRRLGLFILAALGAALLASGGFRRIRLDSVLAICWLAFVLLACLSVLWADDPALCVRRVAVLAILTVAALGIASRCTFRDLAMLAVINGLVVIVVGLLSEILLGTFQPGLPGYRFSGLLNPIGTASSLAMFLVAAWVYSHQTRGSLPVVFLVASVVAVALLLLTRSRGPTGALICGLAIVAGMTWPSVRTLVIACLALFVTSIIVILFNERILELLPQIMLLGRETESLSTLTGRVPLWHAVMPYIAERPLQGFGYNSFWTSERFARIALATDFNVADVHNSYINLLLGLGYPGLLLGSMIMLGALVKTALIHAKTNDVFAAFSVAILAMQVINGFLLSVYMSESLTSFLPMIIMARVIFATAPAPAPAHARSNLPALSRKQQRLDPHEYRKVE